MAPRDVSIDRFNTTHMNVTWERLTLEEARGFITAYTITYDSSVSRRKRAAGVKAVDPDQSYAVIGGLELAASYYVILSASTAIGPGINTIITVKCKCVLYRDQGHKYIIFPTTAVSYSIFQLRFTGLRNCNQWMVCKPIPV